MKPNTIFAILLTFCFFSGCCDLPIVDCTYQKTKYQIKENSNNTLGRISAFLKEFNGCEYVDRVEEFIVEIKVKHQSPNLRFDNIEAFIVTTDSTKMIRSRHYSENSKTYVEITFSNEQFGYHCVQPHDMIVICTLFDGDKLIQEVVEMTL